MSDNGIFKQAFVEALPIIGSYFFVSIACGLMMQAAGFGWGWSLFTSMTYLAQPAVDGAKDSNILILMKNQKKCID